MIVLLDPDHEPKYQKNLEAIFLETFLDAKPGRVTKLYESSTRELYTLLFNSSTVLMKKSNEK